MRSALRALALSPFLTLSIAAQATIHVPGDAATIQGGIVLAQDGDTVLVAPGIYDEELDYLGKAITLRSETGAAATILTSVNTAVSFVNGEGAGSVLRGFTVTGNRNSSRAAIYCVGATPLVQQCVVRDNRTSVCLAAGIWGDATVEDCVIEDNVNGNGTAGVAGALTLRRCVLRGNWGYDGAAAFLTGGNVEDCQITANTSEEGSNGGAVFIASSTVVVLRRCLVAGNTKGTLGGLYAAHGAGVTVESSSATALLVNCTIADNHVVPPNVWGYPDYGGVAGSATLVSCIALGNDGVQVDVPGAIYSDIIPGMPGTGNFVADPLFRDRVNGDYRLQPGSPCIDTGHPAGQDADGSRADVGAYYLAHAIANVLPGSGANPLLFSSLTPPAIGTSWQTAIQASLVAGTVTSGFQVRTNLLSAPRPTAYGEFLVGGPLLFAMHRTSSGNQDVFNVPIPADLDLIGLTGFAQGYVIANPGGIRLGNGLALLLGE